MKQAQTVKKTFSRETTVSIDIADLAIAHGRAKLPKVEFYGNVDCWQH